MSITIVGGGISGLSLAYFLLEKDPLLEIQVLEAAERPGGKICSDRTEGFLCEKGVNGFLDNKPLTLELARALSLTPIRSNESAKRRFIYSRGRLHPIPESPQAFLTSGILTPCGKGRLIYEVIVPGGGEEDESLADFARRRLGREAYERLIDPMASGIYAGDPEMLSLKSCFPRIYQLEKRHGSLLRAMVKLQREAKKRGESVGPGPGGTLTSFTEGMETMVGSLRDLLGNRLKTGRRVKAVERVDDRYRLHTEDGGAVDSETVVLACPAYESSEILSHLDPSLSRLLGEIPYPALSIVCTGFRLEEIGHNLNGFGFLVPGVEGRRILGTLWDSSIFPRRAPEGYVLLRTMVGGARAPELALEDDVTLTGIVLEELEEVMGIDVQPSFVRIYRHEKAIPQYNVGHAARLERMDRALKRHPGLYITGNAYRGIGVNDCVENSHTLCNRILTEN